MRSDAVAQLFAEMVRRPIECSLAQLIDRLQPEADGLLGQIEEIAKTLERCNVKVTPSFKTGEIDTQRLLQFDSTSDVVTSKDIDVLVARGESGQVEFKSTLHFHVDKEKNAPGLPSVQYKSDDVLHSSLKTIAAYLNSGGGVLIIGIADDQSVVGVEKDYSIPDTSNSDKWELHLRNCIAGKFKDGPAINDYVAISLVSYAERTVAHIQVAPRGKLCVIKDSKGNHKVYRRQGNKSDSVELVDIEEFIELRRQGR